MFGETTNFTQEDDSTSTNGGNFANDERMKAERADYQHTKRVLFGFGATTTGSFTRNDSGASGHLSNDYKDYERIERMSANVYEDELSVEKKPVVTLEINNLHYKALIDSGSDVNIISVYVYNAIGRPQLQNDSLQISGIGMSTVRSLGKCTLRVCVDEHYYDDVIFHVLRKDCIPYNVILGQEFLNDVTVVLKGSSARFVDKEWERLGCYASEMCSVDSVIGHMASSALRKEVIQSVQNYRPRQTKETPLQLKIVLKDEVPVAQRPRRLSLMEQEIVDAQVAEWLDKGIIQAWKTKGYTCPPEMIPMIVRVWCESGAGWAPAHVPVTPQSTCRDVLDCCREPGDEPCLLLSVHPNHGVHVLKDTDLPLEVAAALGPDVQFVLKYVETGSTNKSNGMKEPGSPEELLGEGVELTLGELRAMALRQQQQIDTQHQLLCAKEQRLRYLKQQEARQHQVAVEGERLRRLRERVEAQELKLRRLRALRGQLEPNKQANIALSSDLESIRALFNEKEKELSVAVAKVEELTRQLEELRRGRVQPQPPSAAELDKLRRELMYRNKLNEQQNGRLSAQRAALGARQEEMRSIDRRVSELQARLVRKRALNRQLAAAHRQPQPQPQRISNPTPMQQLPNYPAGGANSQPKNQTARGNIAAVEPYNHVPHAPSLSHNTNFQAMKQNVIQNNVPLKQLTQSENIQTQLTQEAHYLQQKQIINPLYNGYPHLQPGHQDGQYQGQYNKPDINSFSHVQQGISNAYDQKPMFDHINKYPDYPKQPQYSPNSTSSSNSNQTGKEMKINEQEFLPEFAASKSDPKYQTLPYNTKFPQSTNGKLKPEVNSKSNENQDAKNQNAVNVNHMTVHSTPLSVVNKSLATPLSQNETTYQNDHTYQLQKSDSSSRCSQEGKENHAYPQNIRLSQNSVQSNSDSVKNNAMKSQQNSMKGSSPSLGTTTTSTSSMGFGKPVSTVAPKTVQVSSGKPSPIYQTSSTKIQPVQPQTVQAQSVPNHVASNVTSQPQIVRNTASGLSSSGSNFSGQNTSQSLVLSPPQSASTPLSTPDISSTDKSPKPALPPKPTIKTPPRQSVNNDAGNQSGDIPIIPVSDNSNDSEPQNQKETNNGNNSNEMIIKARPLTIRKPPLSEQPKLRNLSNAKNGISVSINRRIEMPPAFLFPEMDHLIDAPSEVQNGLKEKTKQKDEVDKALLINNISLNSDKQDDSKENIVSDITEQINAVDLNGQDSQGSENVLRRSKKGNLKQGGKAPLTRRVSFDPLALLLDASLEGELELVKKTATQVQNASAANDEGITALHNAICAGHFEIVKFLVELGCDVNAQDSDGWTPLHCAASCNNLPMVRFLVDNGACIFATTLSDHETAAEKCEEDEEGFDGCSEYLYSVQEKLGIMNNGIVYAVFSYTAARSDELSFETGARLQVLRKGDDNEREWWWCRDDQGNEGYVPRNLLGLYPRVTTQQE